MDQLLAKVLANVVESWELASTTQERELCWLSIKTVRNLAGAIEYECRTELADD
jgi:hypothetical protein